MPNANRIWQCMVSHHFSKLHVSEQAPVSSGYNCVAFTFEHEWKKWRCFLFWVSNMPPNRKTDQPIRLFDAQDFGRCEVMYKTLVMVNHGWNSVILKPLASSTFLNFIWLQILINKDSFPQIYSTVAIKSHFGSNLLY